MSRKIIDLCAALVALLALAALGALLFRPFSLTALVRDIRQRVEILLKPPASAPSPLSEAKPAATPPAESEAPVPAPVFVPVMPLPPGATPARPITSPMTWITPDDYPPEALRHEWTGRVTIAWTIGADGRASNCQVISSSGNAALDDATCRLVMTRALYEPAQDTKGRPIVSQSRQTWLWQLPDVPFGVLH
ncbi:MAG TPA: energy transducer TonB [Sphingobium sp.]